MPSVDTRRAAVEYEGSPLIGFASVVPGSPDDDVRVTVAVDVATRRHVGRVDLARVAAVDSVAIHREVAVLHRRIDRGSGR